MTDTENIPAENAATSSAEPTPTEKEPSRPEPSPSAPEEKKPMPLVTTAELDHASPGAHIRSKKTLFRIGLVIAVLNPIVSGLVIGIYFWREPELRREGKIITIVALAWGALMLAATLAAPAKGLGIFPK